MQKGHLICAPVDVCIAKYIITRGKECHSRRLNALSIIFHREMPKFVRVMHAHYLFLRRAYLHQWDLQKLPTQLPYENYAKKGRWYNEHLIERFKKRVPCIELTGNLKGSTRKIIYELATLHGYCWTLQGYKREEKIYNHKRRIHRADDWIDPKELYTMTELRNMKVDYNTENRWIDLGDGTYKWNPDKGTYGGVMGGSCTGLKLSKCF